jgi:hypothetical protein
MALYNAINNTTYQDIASVNNSKEQIWVLKVDFESRGTNPYTRFTSGYGPKYGGKPIMEVADSKKVKGDTINMTTLAGLGGPGVQGDGVRIGLEEKIRTSGYQFTLGRMFKHMAWSSVATNQTVVGSNLNRQSAKMLGEWLGWRKGTDIEVAMQVAAATNAGARNLVYANGKASREALRTNDYITGSAIAAVGMKLNTFGGKPCKIGKAQGGWDIKKFIFMGNQYSLYQWGQSSQYQAMVAQAIEKGETNPLFAGGYPDVDGHALFRWDCIDHANFGPLGSPGIPRALLGNAITAADTLAVIDGGGSAAGAAITPAPLYFENFSGAEYVGFEGVKRAAVTNVERYVAIQNTSGASMNMIGFYAYQTNNGNTLIPTKRLRASDNHSAAPNIAYQTVGNVIWGTAPWTTTYVTDSHPSGSLILECNSYGVPFVKSYMFADEALMSGYGSIDGKVAFGIPAEEKQDYGRVRGVGIDSCWGVQAVPRVDGLFCGFIVVESGWKPDGWPDVT